MLQLLQLGMTIKRQSSVEAAAFAPASLGRQAQLLVRAGVHEHDMFELIAPSAYEAIETVFNSTRNTSLRRRALDGFKNYAIVASYYGLQEHFDRLLALLCRQFVGLSTPGDANSNNGNNGHYSNKSFVSGGGKLIAAARRAEEAAKKRRHEKILRMQEQMSADHENYQEFSEQVQQNSPVKSSTDDQKSITVTPLSKAERQALRESDPLLNSRAMLLISCITHLTREHGHMVRHGWRKVIQCVVLLFELGALPRDLTHMPWSLIKMDDIVKRRCVQP